MKQTRFFRFISRVVLVTVFLSALSPTNIFAQSGTAGPLTWNISGNTLTISGNGAMPNYVASDVVPWYPYRSSIYNVIMETGVTSIGNNAFAVCALTSVTIPNGVTSIGNSAFVGCLSLPSVTIPNSVTNIGSVAFHSCSSLLLVTIPNSVTIIGEAAFHGCSNLHTVYFNANCTTMGSSTNPVFNNCPAFTALNIGNNVTIIPAYAFMNCSSLTSVTIPESITSIGNHAFFNCSNLQSVNFNATNCTSMGSSTYYSVFSNCNAFTTLNIGSNVTRIPVYAFDYCNSLQTVNFNATNCTTMGSSTNPVFNNCPAFTTLNISNNVTKIPDYAFYGCSNIGVLTIPNGVTSIGISAFRNCSSLQTVNFNATNCITMSFSLYPAFSSCPAFTTLNIGNNVETIPDFAFSSCSSLTSITSYPTTPPILYPSTFDNVSRVIPVNVLCVSLHAYRSAPIWESFINYQTMGGSVPSQPGIISGPTIVCLGGDAHTYSISPVPDATSYTWNLPTGWSGNSTGISISAIPGSNAQSGNISVMANSNNCGSSIARTLNVTVNTSPAQPGPISGPTTVCASIGGQVYSISAVSGATSYTWSAPSGWDDGGSSTGTSFSFTPFVEAESGNISVTANNGCGSSPASTLYVMVHMPPTIIQMLGPTSVCAESGAYTYSIWGLSSPELSYTWSLPSGWSGSSTTDTISATPGPNAQSGVITVKIDSDYCGSKSTGKIVNVSTAPTAPTDIGGKNNINLWQSTTLYALGGSVGGGCTYQWGTGICGNNIIPDETDISITVSPNVTTTYWVRRIGDPCNETTDCATKSVTVNLGINENTANQIQISPNPTTGELKIESGELKVESIEIFDVYGRNLLILFETTLNITHLSAGVYFVKIHTEKGEIVRKVLKE